jgi:ADP-heptose:LPS heptosyltransferase
VTAHIGPIGELFPAVGRIAVLRGGGLGDLVLALPAVESLHKAYPVAEIVLLGTPLHAQLLERRPSPIDRVVCLPVARGVHEPRPGVSEDPECLRRFFASMADERFDLAVQMHGGGRWSNPFLRRLGARFSVGTRTPDAVALDRWLPHQYYQHELLRWLEVVGLAGAQVHALRADVPVTEDDRAEASRVLSGLPLPLVTLHPGATDARRRWPAERFAEVASQVVLAGGGVAVVGDDTEANLVQQVVNTAERLVPSRMRTCVRGLAGQVSVGGLTGVLACSGVVVANDSGPRHLAEAVGTPTVSVFWCGNMINSGPLGRLLHRTHISWTTACPDCGTALTTKREECGHQTSWMADIPTTQILSDVGELLEQRGDRHARIEGTAEHAAPFAEEGAGHMDQGA